MKQYIHLYSSSKKSLKYRVLLIALLLPFFIQAQTLSDGIYMPKNNFCGGVMMAQDKFDTYWEGTTKRQNANMGTMTMKSVGVMANYGISDELNVIASLPYVQTKASAGTMSGMSGIQDLTVALKYKVLKISDLSANIIVGGSLPVTDYVAAFPLAIGNQSKTLFGRAMLHYLSPQGLTATAHATYNRRSNIEIDATNYYTDKNIFSREVAMPDVANFSVRAGYYTYRVAAEVVLDKTTTLGGFDIRRNDMMFPSNRINSTRLGLTAFYRVKPLKDLQIVANYAYTLQGRNVGQATSVALGLMMAFDFNKASNNPSMN